jgi:hypothetical protein
MDEIWKSFAAGGIPGCILAYILWKIVPAINQARDDIRSSLRSMEHAINSSSKSDLLRLIASPHVAVEVKAAASEILREIETAETASTPPIVPPVTTKA